MMKSEQEIKDALETYRQHLDIYLDTAIILGAAHLEAVLTEESDADSIEVTTELLTLEIKIEQLRAMIAILEWVLNQKYAYDRRN